LFYIEKIGKIPCFLILADDINKRVLDMDAGDDHGLFPEDGCKKKVQGYLFDLDERLGGIVLACDSDVFDHKSFEQFKIDIADINSSLQVLFRFDREILLELDRKKDRIDVIKDGYSQHGQAEQEKNHFAFHRMHYIGV
jgi:hypothetical protein